MAAADLESAALVNADGTTTAPDSCSVDICIRYSFRVPLVPPVPERNSQSPAIDAGRWCQVPSSVTSFRRIEKAVLARQSVALPEGAPRQLPAQQPLLPPFAARLCTARPHRDSLRLAARYKRESGMRSAVRTSRPAHRILYAPDPGGETNARAPHSEPPSCRGIRDINIIYRDCGTAAKTVQPPQERH